VTNLSDGGSDDNDSTGTPGTDGPCSNLLGGAFDYEFDADADESTDTVFRDTDTPASDGMLTLWHDERTEEFGAPEYDADAVQHQSPGDGMNGQSNRRYDLDPDDAWSDFRARIVRKPDGTFDIAPPAPIDGTPPPNADAEATVVDDPQQTGVGLCRVCGRATYPCSSRGERLTADGTCQGCRRPLPFWQPVCDRLLCVGCDQPAEYAFPNADELEASELTSCTCSPIA